MVGDSEGDLHPGLKEDKAAGMGCVYSPGRPPNFFLLVPRSCGVCIIALSCTLFIDKGILTTSRIDQECWCDSVTCCNSHQGFWMAFFSNILCTTTCVQRAGFAIDELHANLVDFRLGPRHFSFHQPEIEDSFFPKVKTVFPKQEQALAQPLQSWS